MSLDLGISEIESSLMKKEEKLDKVMTKSREIVRLCSNAIKAIHSREFDEAKKLLKASGDEVAAIKKFEDEFPGHVNHIMQEYVEARIVFSAVRRRKNPFIQGP